MSQETSLQSALASTDYAQCRTLNLCGVSVQYLEPNTSFFLSEYSQLDPTHNTYFMSKYIQPKKSSVLLPTSIVFIVLCIISFFTLLYCLRKMQAKIANLVKPSKLEIIKETYCIFNLVMLRLCQLLILATIYRLILTIIFLFMFEEYLCVYESPK